jgi:hypothetical protein
MCYPWDVDAVTVQCMAALVSFTGLYGVLNKRPWGPFLCGISSGVWFGIALSTYQYPWAAVEMAYSLVNFGTSRAWAGEKPPIYRPCPPGCYPTELPPPVPKCVCDSRPRPEVTK